MSEIPNKNSYTPWGKVQDVNVLAPGIVNVSTASHGGIWLSPEKRKAMPNKRKAWYEEDCEWSLVALAFPEYFELEQPVAEQTAKNYFPEDYEKLTGKPVKVEESLKLSEGAFNEKHRNDLVVISAVNVGNGLVKCVATLGGDRSAPARTFLIPGDEYRTRSRFGFVIENPSRYEELIKV